MLAVRRIAGGALSIPASPPASIPHSEFRIPHSASGQARTIFSRPAVTPLVAFRVSTTSRLFATTQP